MKISESPFGSKITHIFDMYNDILAFNNETIRKIADASLQSLRATSEQLSHGTYTINADELPTYLFPMIQGAKQSFHATQYVFPEKFWGQYWAPQYFEENINAVKQRHIRPPPDFYH